MTRTGRGPVGTARIVNTAQLDATVLDVVYNDLLVPAFPEDELVDHATFHAAYGAGESSVPGLVALDEGRPVGVALGERHQGTGIVLLGYLAVSTSQRSRGFGAALVDRLRIIWGADPATTAVLAEVEDPRSRPVTRFGDPWARVRFYFRCGARLLPIDYFQPRLAPHLARVEGMLLLSLLADRSTVGSAALLTWVDDYLLGAEGAVPGPHDTAYAQLRDSILRHGPVVPAQEIGPDLRG